jgi:hypothetical protein
MFERAVLELRLGALHGLIERRRRRFSGMSSKRCTANEP